MRPTTVLFIVAAVWSPAVSVAGQQRSARMPSDSTDVSLPFAKYPASPAFHGTPAAIDFRRDTAARHFRARLRWTHGDTVNFAGHFRLEVWGCGTECQFGAIVDARTGRVHFLPEEGHAGYLFRLGSRLLVVNPPDEIRELNEGYPPNVEHERVTTSFYVWNDTTWKSVRVRGQ